MSIKNNTKFEFLEDVVKDALVESNFRIDGKPVENIDIVHYDETNHGIFVEACECRFLIWIEKGFDKSAKKIEWHLYLFRENGNHSHLFAGKTKK